MIDLNNPAITNTQLLDALVKRRVLREQTARAIGTRDRDAIAKSLPEHVLVEALRDCGCLTDAEAEALTNGDDLEDLYQPEGVPSGEQFDGTAYEQASAAIRYGNLAEALIQVGRILPGLDRLGDLVARVKGA